MATVQEVEDFLQLLRDKMRVYEVAFRPRDKNMEFLVETDILPYQRLLYIKQLSFKNYITGPNKDTYDPAKPDYFEFGIDIKGYEVYIKISIGLTNKMIDCMSFHKAERLINYPLK